MKYNMGVNFRFAKGVDMMEKFFKLKQRGTTVGTEIMAGVITFMTMAYILAVNPTILAGSGMNSEAVMLATCLASFVGTMCMGLMANLPFALSAGMGVNAFFAYTVCGTMGYSWQVALFAVFCEGVIFILMTLTNIREAIFNCIPIALKQSVSVGIGLFIAFIGLQNSGLVVKSDSTLVDLVAFMDEPNTRGLCALLAVMGLLLVAILHIKKVHGAILIGIFATWIAGIICELIGIYKPDAATGFYSFVPEFRMTDFSALGKTFGQCFNIDFKGVGIFDFIVVIMSFLFVDMFDTIGTLIGVSSKANMLDEEGRLPGVKTALLSDAIATTSGAVFGTSTTTTFVESAAGVGAGGRTGLTAVTTAVLFLLATLLAPIFTAIPSFATAPALIFVGFLMFSNITKIKFDDDNLTDAIPAFFGVVAMPLFYSIADGIAVGVISYVAINLACGKVKKIHPLMYVLTVLFILNYVFL